MDIESTQRHLAEFLMDRKNRMLATEAEKKTKVWKFVY